LRFVFLDRSNSIRLREAMEQWFFSKGGQQEGPVTPQQIQALAAAGQLDPATTFVWHEGLADWQALGDSGLLAGAAAPARALPAPPVAASFGGNPYTPPREAYQPPVRKELEFAPQYPGYGRLRYFLTNLIITVVFYAIMFAVIFAALGSGGGEGAGGAIMIVILVLGLGVMVVSFYTAYQRVKNLGMSGWALLWTLVPIMNMWIGWRMFACPAGYEDHRTLDTAGKVISGIVIGLIALMIVANIIVAVSQS
jgi:uncharacterized membrane protein YhaH (DUF805 family)